MAVGKVSANPGDLRRFAGQLQQFSKDVDQSLARLMGQFRALNWDDEERNRFEADLQKQTQAIKRLVADLEHFRPALMRKAQALEEFLRAR